jgi:hypothetical protein
LGKKKSGPAVYTVNRLPDYLSSLPLLLTGVPPNLPLLNH